jgi:hypothetical protein
MSGAATAIGIGTAVAGVAGAGASIYGGSKQAAAANNAANLQQQQFEQTQKNQAPFIQAGQNAVGTIQSDLNNQTGFATPFSFQADPGYQFNLTQGENAINSSSAAQGGVLNGGTLKALSQYASGLADTTYSSAYNRYLEGSQNSYNQLAGLANLGEGATTNTGNAGAAAANAAGNYGTQAANATAAGAVGASNAVGGSINTFDILNALQRNGSASSYGPFSATSNIPNVSTSTLLNQLNNPNNWGALEGLTG